MMALGIIKIAVLLCCLASTIQAGEYNINMKSYGIKGECAFKPNPLLESFKKDIEEENNILKLLKTAKKDDLNVVKGIIERVIKLADTEFGRVNSKYQTEYAYRYFKTILYPEFRAICNRYRCDPWLYVGKTDQKMDQNIDHYNDIIKNKKVNHMYPEKVLYYEELIPFMRVYTLTRLVSSWLSHSSAEDTKRDLINSYRFAKWVRDMIDLLQAGRCRIFQQCDENVAVKEGWFVKTLTSFKIHCYCWQKTKMDTCQMDGVARADGKKPWTNIKVVGNNCCKTKNSAAEMYQKQQLIKLGEPYRKLQMAEIDILLGPLLGGFNKVIGTGLDLEKASQSS